MKQDLARGRPLRRIADFALGGAAGLLGISLLGATIVHLLAPISVRTPDLEPAMFATTAGSLTMPLATISAAPAARPASARASSESTPLRSGPRRDEMSHDASRRPIRQVRKSLAVARAPISVAVAGGGSPLRHDAARELPRAPTRMTAQPSTSFKAHAFGAAPLRAHLLPPAPLAAHVLPPVATTAHALRPVAVRAHVLRPAAVTAQGRHPVAVTAHAQGPAAVEAHMLRPARFAAHVVRPAAVTAHAAHPTPAAARLPRAMPVAALEQSPRNASQVARVVRDGGRDAALRKVVFRSRFVTQVMQPPLGYNVRAGLARVPIDALPAVPIATTPIRGRLPSVSASTAGASDRPQGVAPPSQ